MVRGPKDRVERAGEVKGREGGVREVVEESGGVQPAG